MKRIISATSALVVGILTASAVQAQTPLTTELFANGFARPVQITAAPGDSTRMFVVEQTQADIHVIINGVVQGTPFLDLTPMGVNTSGNERGFFSVAFHPDYQSNGQFFVNYTTSSGNTLIERYTRLTNNSADPSSQTFVTFVTQPQSNHNGGGMVFGTDGELYIAMGDGGNFNDVGSGHSAGGNSQDGSTRLGKMLRINVDTLPWSVPAGNPFTSNGSVLDETWALGLRNPWRFSFDRETGDMWIGDVGQDSFNAVGREEINFQHASSGGGENYGWRCKEGFSCTGLSGCTCASPTLTDPVADFTQNISTGGFSIIGGYVYRGEGIPDLWGTYIFGDHVSNNIWRMNFDRDTETITSGPTLIDNQIAPGGGLGISSITSFGEDSRGEIYITDRNGGEVFKLVADGPFEGLGCATEGTNGKPRLYGEGTLVAGSSGALRLENAVISSPIAALFVALDNGAATPVAFKGGTLKAFPWIGVDPIFLTTNGSGETNIPWASWPAGVPAGTEILFQYAIQDGGAAHISGVALSNALLATTP